MGFGNLGVALGAATQEWNNQRKMDREDEILAMQKAAEGRQAEQFGWQRDDQKRKSEIQQRQDAVMRAAQANAGFLQELDGLSDDKLGEFVGRVSQHYNQDPAWANGMYANLTNVEGKPYVVHGNMAKLGGVQMIPVTRDGIRGALGQMNDDLQRRLALAGGAETYMPYASEQQKLALQGRQVGAEETKAGAAVQQAKTMEGYRGDQRRLMEEQIRTGNWGAVGLNAAHAGYFNRMPHDGGGSGALSKDPTKGILGFDEKTGSIWRMGPDGRITSEVLRDASNNPVPTAIVRGLFQGGHNKQPKPDVTVEVPSPDGKGMVKMQLPYDDAVQNGFIQPPIPVTRRENPTALGASSGGSFVPLPKSERTDITRRAPVVDTVYDPLTGTDVPRSEYERKYGGQETMVGRGLRFFGIGN